jgi:hypothetical protein
MINKTNRENVKPFSQPVGLINPFIAAVIAALLVFGCDTGSESDVKNDRDNIEKDAGGTTEPDSGNVTEPDGGMDEPTEPEPTEYATALVITTDYQSGAYSTVARCVALISSPKPPLSFCGSARTLSMC